MTMTVSNVFQGSLKYLLPKPTYLMRNSVVNMPVNMQFIISSLSLMDSAIPYHSRVSVTVFTMMHSRMKLWKYQSCAIQKKGYLHSFPGSFILYLGCDWRSTILFETHFFQSSVSIKSLPPRSFCRLQVVMMMPTNRFIRKKLPMITTNTKKRAPPGQVIA